MPQYTFLVNGDPDLNPVYWSPSNTSTDEPAGVSMGDFSFPICRDLQLALLRRPHAQSIV